MALCVYRECECWNVTGVTACFTHLTISHERGTLLTTETEKKLNKKQQRDEINNKPNLKKKIQFLYFAICHARYNINPPG